MTELSAYVQELYDKGRLTHYEFSVLMHLIEVASGRMHRVLKAKETRGGTNAWD